MLSEEESSVLSKTIREIQDTGIQSEVLERKFRSIRIFSSAFFFLLLSLTTVFALARRLDSLQTTVDKQSQVISVLSEDITSLRLEEQQREEEVLRFKSSILDDVPEGDLSDEVEKNLSALNAVVSSPGSGKNISRGNPKFKEIALTFDLGTGEDLQILYDFMMRFPIKVTLFVSNENPAKKGGSLFSKTNLVYLKKLQALQGRVVFGNHTWSHFNLPRSLKETSLRKRALLSYVADEIPDFNTLMEELTSVEEKFKTITGAELTKYYRLPYGAVDPIILDVYATQGYENHIFWSNNTVGSLDVPDFVYKKYITKKDPITGKTKLLQNPHYKTKQEMLDFLYRWESSDKNGMNGAIILMHLGSPRQSEKLIYILPDFIQAMLDKGYRFVTIPEVLNDQQD
ncbi:polysaccharide deacetylase family protein [Leptospira wolffii]|uniref:Polysaccharide deacetylase n=1 Tax=Leptospira wolffii TaxID=409998 RepID=A0A2M9Z9Q9_9LEPT|nr:polysaccharide deacetylase family protein [Leptospira wolffii]PJZ65123.1 polysaccharide deacetylase [Leptospira wolffii]TGK56753.1 polysaccharide deacetylase family protein [Leptospira wolffii]TGK71665.1 polysaccharide deacetylase family protein [Leptospira wolffii]TGK75478.1 polysaccharide deacetylase family protein [Leptospira wolffii]TGL33032.1 polysaccharide deacetylase family protein [Leptospira wolffii]